MANKPVFGIAKCPHCGHKCPVFWNGNLVWKCQYCMESFKVKRQKLTRVVPVEQPKEEDYETTDNSQQ